MKNSTKLVAGAVVMLSTLAVSAQGPVDLTSRIGAGNLLNEWRGTNAGWSQADGVAELYNLTNAQKYQILVGMPAGIYTLECNGFYRYGANHSSADSEDSVEGFIYIKPGTTFSYNQSTAFDPDTDDDVNKYGVKVKSLYSENAYTYEPYTFPDRTNTAAAAFAKGEYKNSAKCILESDGCLRLGFTTPSQWRAQRSWLCVGNFKLYYQENENSERLDVTDRLANPDFATSPNVSWSEYPVTIEDETAIAAGAHEWYRKTINMTQTISGLDAGKYKVCCQAFRRGTDNVYLIANEEKIGVADFYSIKDEIDLKGKENIAGAGSLFADGHYVNSLFVRLSEGEDLKIGIVKEAQSGTDWVAIRNYTLTYLPMIESPVLDLPDMVGGILYHDFSKGSRDIEILSDEEMRVYYMFEPEQLTRNVERDGFMASENGVVTVDSPGTISYYVENKDGQESEVKSLVVKNTTPTSVVEILQVDRQEAEYYNLQGVRISVPAKGDIVIEKKGTEVRKIVY